MKLTKSFIDKIAPPTDKDQVFYRDEELKGFALRVTSNGTKSFVVEKLIGNKVKRITLGKYGALTVQEARKEAKIVIGKITMGNDPVAEKQAARIKGITLKDAFQEYFEERKLKPKTLYDYRRIYEVAFDKWHHKPLAEITKEMVAKHHKLLGEESGEAYANLAMRILRAVINHTIVKHEDTNRKLVIAENPTSRLTKTHAWYRVERRKTLIKAHQLSDWYKGLSALAESRGEENAAMWQDYFLLILLTGLRRTEAASIERSKIDLKDKTFTVYDTKNHEDHTLPMSDFLYQLFERRLKASQHSKYIFPAESATGHIVEPRKAKEKIVAESNIGFTTHDLRRTFITIAESLDISTYTLKRLLNHKMKNDVTAGYIVLDVERLRKPMQMITDFILQSMMGKNERLGNE